MGQSLDYVLSEEDKSLIVEYYTHGSLYPESKGLRRTTVEARLSHFRGYLDEGNFHHLCTSSLYRAFSNQLVESEASVNVLVLWDFLKYWAKTDFPDWGELTRREAMAQLLELKKIRLSAKLKPRKPTKPGHFDTYLLGA